MSPKQGLSLRYKILLLLALLPALMLAAYLGLAVNIFKDDKLAYVFESSSAVARTLSSQATTELNSTLNAAKPLIQEYLHKNAFAEVARGLFDVEGPLLWVAAYAPKKEVPGQFEKLEIAERDPGTGQVDLDGIGALPSFLSEAEKKGRLVHVPFRDDRVLIIERVGDLGAANEKLFVILTRLNELASAFRNPGSSENYFVNDQGYVLFGPAGSEASLISEKTGVEFLRKANEQKFSSGAEGLKSKIGEDLLASYSKAGFGQTTVISLVPKKEALKAVTVLVQRSIIFLCMLLSATVILSLFASNNLTSALTDLFHATRQVAEGHFDVQVKVKSHDEVGSLAGSFNAMAAEVSRLMMETAEKARMESELKTAKMVQETLFPPMEADFGSLKIAGYYEPASECGGDWWHYCVVDNKVYLWIGDATGHGAPAALMTSAAKSAATIIERLSVGPNYALELLNRAIYDVSKGKLMMTFFLGMFDLDTQEFIYCNASHETPFLIHQGDAPPKKKDLLPLNEVNNPRLGQSRETKYDQTSIKLTPGDRIIFYTDGVPDIQNKDHQGWGEREFIKAILAANASYPPVSAAVRELSLRCAEYRQQTPLIDDITFFMCHYTGKA